jgi:hypothetical protein
MICQTCYTPAGRIKVIDGKDHCRNCSSISETGGSKIDGSITRNSFRVRQQQQEYKADLTPPHVYDKASKKLKVNKDFVKLFPEQSTKTFSNEEFKQVGINKLKGIDKV